MLRIRGFKSPPITNQIKNARLWSLTLFIWLERGFGIKTFEDDGADEDDIELDIKDIRELLDNNDNNIAISNKQGDNNEQAI